MIKSKLRLNDLRKSAQPLQNEEVRRIYRCCLDEMNITKAIPIYSTAFLKSPVIVGLFKPCIYLPIHLISDEHASDIRYMLLHELQHYTHKDAAANYLMNFAVVIYWFNPFVWYTRKEMRSLFSYALIAIFLLGFVPVLSIQAADQTLESAMQNSVNWYFQAIDEQNGLSAIKDYVREIGYGNQVVSGSASSYWLNSSLKISPIEQVECCGSYMITNFRFLRKPLKPSNIRFAFYLLPKALSTKKTGTESVDGQNISGRFIGFIEKGGHTYFFATNIQDENDAASAAAAALTFSILSDLNIWNQGE